MMIQRALQGAGTVNPAQAGYLQWRVKQRVPDGVKVFCMAGGWLGTGGGGGGAGSRSGLG